MSIKESQVLDRDTLNKAFVSKSATGTQIMAGSLRLLGGVTIDGVTTLGALTVGAINAGASTITTTGTITAGTFSGAHSGVGTLLTALNATNIASGTVADARLSTNVVLLNKAQTFTANNTYSAAANLYFAGGTTYKIDTTGSADFNSLSLAGSLTVNGPHVSFGLSGVAAPSDMSTGTKLKLYGNQYQIGIEGNSIWYDSTYNHKFYSNSGTATRTLRAEITEIDTHIFTDLNVDKNLEVAGEFKAGLANEFPDPLLTSKSTSLWPSTSNGTLTFDSVQFPVGTGAIGSLKIVASAADAFSYSSVLFDATPNEWVTYSFYNFCTTASKTGDLYIQWLNASQAHISYSGVSFTASTGWARQRVTAQAPATARFFKIRIGNSGGAGAIMYYSALQIEYGKTLTGFKPYTGGTTASFFDKGIKLGAGGEIHSAHNNNYIIKDHANGDVTLNAAGLGLYLGYQNTTKVVLSADLYASNTTTKIIDKATGTLYYQGIDTDSRYVNAAGDSMTGVLSISDSGATPFSVTRTSTTANVGISYSNSSNILHAGAVLGVSSADFGIGLTADLASAKFKVNATTGEITVNGNKVWHAGNDGASSGLDADTLDGIHGAQLLRKDVSDIMSGNLTIANSGNPLSLKKSAAGAGNLWFNFRDTANTEIAWIGYGSSVNDTFTISNSLGEIVLSPGNAIAKVGTNVIWHAGNDGAGSGLDADTIDGIDSSRFIYGAGAPGVNNVTDLNTLWKSGFYEVSSGTNAPSNDEWYWVLNAGHTSNSSTYRYNGQLAFKNISSGSPEAYVRSTSGSGTISTTSWARLWHDKNDGVGSGLDADLLDGLQGGSYLRSDASDTFTGTLTLVGSQTISGTLGVLGNLGTDGDLSFSKLPYLKGIAGAYREGGKMNLLGRLSGRLLNRNPDFINNTMTGYTTYDNNSSGRLIRSIIADDVIPNSTGKLMRMDYNPARNAGVVTAPGFGGFVMSTTRSISNPTNWGYKAGNRYIFRLIAKIPIGRSINMVSNSMGTGGGSAWLTPVAGTGDWQEYIHLLTVGNTGTFADTGYFSITGGADVAFTWDVASCQAIGIDETPDVDRAPTLNVGYKSGVDVGWGEIYSTGKITTDTTITSNDLYVRANGSLFSASGSSWFKPMDTVNNMHIKAGEGNKSLYIDANTHYFRTEPGVLILSLSSSGATVEGVATIKGNASVGGTLTLNKTGNVSTLAFPAGTGGNDPAYIKHIETTSNSGIMQFSASDDPADNDYFSFGATPSSVYTEGARITTLGNATFKATTVTSLTSSGNVVVSGDLAIPTTSSNKAALSIGGVTIGQVVANSGEFIMTNLSELRFGTATNATWDYNKWGGIKYITTSDTMIIGGPASANLTGNPTPPRIKVNFEGLTQANFDGKVIINDTAASTIAGTTMANGWLQIGTGLSLDPNEMYFSGADGVIGTIGAFNLVFQSGAVTRMTVSPTGASVVGAVTATGEVSGTKVTASGGVSLPSGQSVYIGTWGNTAASLRLTYDGANGYMDYGGDLYFRPAGVERMRLSAAGNLGVKVAPSATYGISSDSIIVSNWLRTTGATGWYSETYGGGWNMSDATWIRNFGSKSLFIGAATSVLRTEGKLEVGAGTAYTAAADLQVVAGASGTFNYRNVLYSDGAKVGIGAASATHPLDVHTSFGAQGINLQTTDDALTNGFSLQNSAGTYSWHLARNGTGVSPDLVLYGGSNATLSSLTEKVRYYNNGDTNFANRMFVRGNSGLAGAPGIALAIGDADTGFDWVSDGVLKMMANNVAIAQFANTYMNLNVTTTITGGKDLVIKGATTDAGDIIFQANTGVENARVYSNPGALYLSAGPSVSANATITTAGLGVVGKTTSSTGFSTGKFEIVHNATEDSLDFVYTG